MRRFLLPLNAHPIGCTTHFHFFKTCGHREIDVSGLKFGLDLFVDRI